MPSSERWTALPAPRGVRCRRARPASRSRCWKYFRKHGLRSALTVAGIVLGVAVFVGMHTANESVLYAFLRTMDRIAGAARRQVSAGEARFEEQVLEILPQARPSLGPYCRRYCPRRSGVRRHAHGERVGALCLPPNDGPHCRRRAASGVGGRGPLRGAGVGNTSASTAFARPLLSPVLSSAKRCSSACT